MDPLTAEIRPYAAEDSKLALFIVGKANMEQLAVANNRVYTDPVTISLWVLLSAIFVQYMKWWPASTEYGWVSYLRPLPALASMAVPIMFFVDWINRPYFEKLTQETLRQPDMTQIAEHYTLSPGSGFWILEYGNRFVGLIALDASPAQIEGDEGAKKAKKAKTKQGETPHTAIIRHFYVDEAFRGARIQDDLLVHAVDFAFSNDPTLVAVQATDSPLASYTREALRKAGFQLDQYTDKVGILGWKLGVRVMERSEWKKTKTG